MRATVFTFRRLIHTLDNGDTLLRKGSHFFVIVEIIENQLIVIAGQDE
jgi:hypothetical protein